MILGPSGCKNAADLAVDVGDLSAQHDATDDAFEAHPSERRPLRFGEGRRGGHVPLMVQIHLHVRVLLLGQVEDAPRIHVQLLNQVLKKNRTGCTPTKASTEYNRRTVLF